jgi:hypothetical protein
MPWEVEYTDEFKGWWDGLRTEEQDAVAITVELLEIHGPTLKRPHSDVITTSRHANMKELRAKVKGKEKHLRVLYAFDTRRTAILLIGGDKTGNPSWYEQFVPLADKLFDLHLKQVEDEHHG